MAGVALDNIGSDMGKMAPMNDALAAAYGRRPGQHLADGGFAKRDDIEALAHAGVVTFVPVPQPRDKSRERHQPRPADGPAVAAWRRRMAGEEAKAIYKQRAATAELVNAQARNRGLTRFPVRGTAKAKAVALWHALAHNMACAPGASRRCETPQRARLAARPLSQIAALLAGMVAIPAITS